MQREGRLSPLRQICHRGSVGMTWDFGYPMAHGRLKSRLGTPTPVSIYGQRTQHVKQCVTLGHGNIETEVAKSPFTYRT